MGHEKVALTRNESVVVNGAFRIDSAMQIAAKPSMMTPGGGGGGNPHAGHGGMAGDSMPEMPLRVPVPDSFVFALKPVYAAYLDAQESLAADDLGGFIQAASDIKTALGFIEEAGLVPPTPPTASAATTQEALAAAARGEGAACFSFAGLGGPLVVVSFITTYRTDTLSLVDRPGLVRRSRRSQAMM